MGSGTTGKMAIRNNRNFIGHEKVKKYFDISEKRILEEIDKTSLFNSLGGRQVRLSA
jgi:DNA modification methylase